MKTNLQEVRDVYPKRDFHNTKNRKLKTVSCFIGLVLLVVILAISLVACNKDQPQPPELNHHDAIDATCTENGNIEYWENPETGVYYSDEWGQQVINKKDTVISKTGHSYPLSKIESKSATCKVEGNIEYWQCEACNARFRDENGRNEISELDTVIKAPHIYDPNTFVEKDPWEWGNDYSWAIFHYMCYECGASTSESAEIAQDASAKYDVDVNVTYTASVVVRNNAEEDIIIQDKREGTIPALLVFELQNDRNSYKVIGNNIKSDKDTDVIIPNEYKNKPVTAIGQRAFENKSNITSVIIPNSITQIESEAFYGCSGLKEISIPFVGGSKSATSASPSTLFGYIFGESSYPGGMQVQQSYNSDSDSYATYYIPQSLTKVTVTGNMLYGAFYNCSNISSVTIGDDVTSIGSDAFYGCSGLKAVRITDLEKWCRISFLEYSSANPLMYAKNLYLNGELVTDLVIPDSISTIKFAAFYNCTSLTSLTLNNVTTIENWAFRGCTGLTSVIVPDRVASIELGAFSACTNLTEITIPFVGVSRKTSSSTNQYPFGYIFGTSIYIGGTATTQYYYGDSTSSITYTTYYIPNSLKKVTVTGGNILYGAFYNCSNIKSVTIGGSVTSIGRSAFCQCSGLTSLNISGCVTSIGSSAFSGCSGLASITVSDDNIKYHSKNHCLIETDTKTLIIGCKNSSIPSDGSVTSIGSYAFDGCSELVDVIIPDSIERIDEFAFIRCNALNAVYVYDIAKWCEILFGNAFANPLYYAHNLYLNGELITDNLIIPYSATRIGDYAFNECSGLTIVTIGSRVTSIGSNAFSGCINLTSVKIPDCVVSIGDSAFSGCSGLTSLIIGEKVTSIGSNAFGGCINLTSVTIPDSVKSIGESAFSECSALTRVSIGSSVSHIAKNAFLNCDALTKIAFTNADNWYANKDDVPTLIIEYTLSNEETAAKYLTDDYCDCEWKRID